VTQEQAHGHSQAIKRTLIEIFLPAIGFGLGVGFATQDYAASLVTGLAISGTIYVLYQFDLAFLRPRLEMLSRDWVRVGLEMAVSLFEHLLGALLALLVCSRLFGLRIVLSAAWLALAAMVIAVPIIHGTDMALRFYRQLKETERQEEKLRALATEAELTALKAQINPHFLFNTLNTVAQLIHTDSARAEATIERLAEMFRYVLAGSKRKWVPLEDELAFVDGYLEIERARFGDRLRVSRNVAPQALNLLVPSLILQPLVENAVRHGRASDGSIDLALRIAVVANELSITIADRGPGMPPSFRLGEGPGLGLRNVDERLRKTYGENCGLEITDNQPQGTTVTIRIPGGGRA
jgi:two-component system LytT family sensor kinase